MAFSQKLFTSLQNYNNPDTRIGELNRIWYDSINNCFRIQLDKTTPGGTIIGGGGSGNYTLPTATASVLGGVKIGSNITINSGVISVAAPFSGSYTDLTNTPTIPTTVTVNGTSITLNSSGTITAAAGTLTGTTLNSSVVTSSLTSVGTLTNLTVTNTITGSISGNAGTVTNGVYTTDTGTVTNTMLAGSIANAKLSNSSITINGTSIALGSSGTVTAAAGTLTGTTLNATVVTSSLTSVGTLTSLSSGAITTTGTLAVNASGGITTNQTTFSLINSSATTVTAFGAATTINLGYTNSVAFSNTFNIATNAQAFSTKTVNIGTGSSADGSTYVNIGSTLGLSYVTVNGTLTATLTGNASTATKLATARAINGVNFDGSAAITVTADAGTLSGSTLASGVTASSLTSVGTLTGVTSNAATAFSAGDSAISNVALSVPQNAAIRDRTNGASVIYFDVSNGGTTNGEFQFRSSNAFTNVLTMNTTAFNVNTNAVVTARTPSLARTAFNSAIDTELTVDEMRFRISNQGGIFPQVIGNTSTRNLAWTVVAARSGSAVTQAGSTGTLVVSNAWTSLYTLGGMDSAGDTYTATLQDKALSRIYRITFMRSDNGSTTGYNIIAERLL
jgi:hypothetical protein